MVGNRLANPVDVELVAHDADKASKRGDLVIVIDVVRATTSIITALSNYAKTVIPVQTVKEAMQLRRKHPDYLLAGEREGVKPNGFDLDNSPLSLTKEKVEGKNLIMSYHQWNKSFSAVKGVEMGFSGCFCEC